jgi:5'-methylthioadenosine phosphorylase
VGMTNVPEVVLAREAGMCYAAVAMVANWAAGMGADHVSDPEIRQASSAMSEQLRRLFERAMALHCDQPCACCGPREAG